MIERNSSDGSIDTRKNSPKLLVPKIFHPIGLLRINAAVPRSKRLDNTAKSFLYANRGENHEYRRGAPRPSVVRNNQLWNFVSVVSVLCAGTRLDVSASQQLVSSFCGAV